jgi:hypothetical protein
LKRNGDMKSALLSLVILSGCAGISTADCGSDWYAVGQRDGRLGADPQADGYAARCGGQIDRARYAEGWDSGWAMRPRLPSF